MAGVAGSVEIAEKGKKCDKGIYNKKLIISLYVKINNNNHIKMQISRL